MTDRDDIEFLIHRYLENDLDEDGARKLNAALQRDPDVARRLAYWAYDQRTLASLPAGAEQQQPRVLRNAASTTPSRRSQFWRTGAALTAACFVALCVLLYSSFKGPGQKLDLAALSIQSGPVQVLRGGKDAARETLEVNIRSGDRIVLGAGAKASLLYRGEQTRLVLNESSDVLIEESTDGQSKRITLNGGRLEAQVAPQPPHAPMIMATSQATATVVGTHFIFELHSGVTRLSVTEGRVKMDAVNGKSELIGAGMFAIADGSTLQRGTIGEVLAVVPAQFKFPDSVAERQLITMKREDVDAYFRDFDAWCRAAPAERKREIAAVQILIQTHPDAYGNRPLQLRAPGKDSARLSSYDLARRNEACFEHIDYIVNQARRWQIAVKLAVFGATGVSDYGQNVDEASALNAAGELGHWLGRRYGSESTRISILPIVVDLAPGSRMALPSYVDRLRETLSRSLESGRQARLQDPRSLTPDNP